MKTPEEIKNGLETCAKGYEPCSGNCTYEESHGSAPKCMIALKEDALAYIQQLEDHIRDLTKLIPKWISVEERLPEKQGDHLVLYSFGETNVDFFAGVMYFIRYDERPHFENDGLYGLHVTHWMPLPESPKEG